MRKRAEVKQLLPFRDYTESLKLYNKILNLQKENTPEYANTLFEIAICYRNQNNLKDTKKYADKALAVVQQNPNNNANLLFDLIQLYKNSNDIGQSKKLMKIIDLTHEDNIYTLSRLSYIHALDENYELSRNYIEQAKKKVDKKLESEITEFDFDVDISMFCQALVALNEYEEEIRYEEKSLIRLKKILGENHNLVKEIMISLSTSYAIIGNYDKAFDILQDSILQNENNPYLLDVLRKQADLMFDIGNIEKAIASYENFLAKKKIEPEQKCDILNSLNGLYMANTDLLKTEGENYESPKFLGNALESLKLSEYFFGINSNEYITSQQIVAGVYCLLDSLDIAKKYADQCLKTINDGNWGDLNKALYLEGLAAVYVQMKDYLQAIELMEKGIYIERQLNEDRLIKENISYHVLAEAYLGSKDFPKAQYYYSSLFKVLSKEIQKNFSFMTIEQRENFWRMYKDQLFNAGKYVNNVNVKDSSFLATVYNAALFSKGILLNSSIELTKLIQDQPELQKKFEEMRRLRVSMQKNTSMSPEEVVNKEKEAERLERELVKKSSEYGNYTNYLNINWKQIKENLKSNEIAIEFIEFEIDKDSVMYAVVAIRNNWDYPHMVTLFEKNDFLNIQIGNKNIKERLNEEQMSELYSNNYLLYNAIWKPLEKFIQTGDNVYFSLVGILNVFAIEYLQDNNSTLVSEKYNLFRCSSTREILNKGKNNKSMYESAALYGGIKYVQNTTKDNLNRNNIKELQYSRAEINSIATILNLPTDKSKQYSDEKATINSIKSLSGENTSIIHIATHGGTLQSSYTSLKKKIDELSLENSYLIFSDGNLTAHEITQLDLRNTSLVILSACQSGLGEINSEGVFGLQRGFKKAGVKTIVMSLWKVDDKATSILMSEFYRNLKKQGNTNKQEALTNAINYLKNYQVETEQDDISQPKFYNQEAKAYEYRGSVN